MLLTPGSILLVTEKSPMLMVTVKKNFGFRPDYGGYLLYTEEGNYVFVRLATYMDLPMLTQVIFITDPETLTRLPKVII